MKHIISTKGSGKRLYRLRIPLLLLMIIMLAASCTTFYPNRMLRTGNHYQYTPLPAGDTGELYRIAPNDELSITVATNDGERLLDPLNNAQSLQAGNTYLVEPDGVINMPLLRRIRVEGLSIRELEVMLEDSLSYFFNHPFVKVQVTNNRVIIFPGGLGGTAQVIRLQNPNTTLFEALALAGGITDGKAYNIKLIRGDPQHRKVYRINLSRIEGLSQADMVLMANDVIYVEPVQRIPEAVLARITPYLSLASTLLVIYAIFR
ncbi:MAG TPA: polysaccharide biosynthesis/export family protein [Bacteroidales bacterium]|nr:polysaccharide biosynthesis/export family protein [Bacteroidales bacterium]HSA44149.1 polysaccharide biosynthesis/export family protein [Bacteroidales bacterium]